ncbi:MAG: ATP-binding protein [Microcoleaceae cyanobacterium]
MATIDQLILQGFNPFDPIGFKSGHFWKDEVQANFSIVDSIHQQELNKITNVIHLTKQDHYTRSVLLTGDKGAGKSYFLGRLKETFNQDAFFAYIAPWPDSRHIWRHTLKYTVDSLMYKPKGQTESQLLLWLKGLTVFKNPVLINNILGNRRAFINNLRAAHPEVRHQAKNFFGALYYLTNPELYPIACDWLRGDDLDEEDLQDLKIKKSIDTEEAARNILENFGRIISSTQPIVLCFDQVENGEPRDTEGVVDLQPLMSLSTTFHNERFKNFVIVVSIIQDKWNNAERKIEQADKDRIEERILLKMITTEQAKELWVSRLYPLHSQANPKPSSPIYPLDEEVLESQYPGGKVTVRSVLQLGQKLFSEYKNRLLEERSESVEDAAAEFNFIAEEEELELVEDVSAEFEEQRLEPIEDVFTEFSFMPEEEGLELVQDASVEFEEEKLEPIEDVSEELISVDNQLESAKDAAAEFNLMWQYEFQEVQNKVSRFRQYSDVERLAMLRNILNLFQVASIQIDFLPNSTYKTYSLSYQVTRNSPSIGIVWMEEPNLNKFCNLMKNCQKVQDQNLCDTLYLIRQENLGTAKNKGYQLYSQIFKKSSKHQHINPNLDSLHYLVTYTEMLNSVRAGELVIGGTTPTEEEFKTLVRDQNVLESCYLLRRLGLIESNKNTEETEPDFNQSKIRDHILNTMQINKILLLKLLVDDTLRKFSKTGQDQVDHIIEQLCAQNKIKIINPSDSYEQQMVYLVV